MASHWEPLLLIFNKTVGYRPAAHATTAGWELAAFSWQRLALEILVRNLQQFKDQLTFGDRNLSRFSNLLA